MKRLFSRIDAEQLVDVALACDRARDLDQLAELVAIARRARGALGALRAHSIELDRPCTAANSASAGGVDRGSSAIGAWSCGTLREPARRRADEHEHRRAVARRERDTARRPAARSRAARAHGATSTSAVPRRPCDPSADPRRPRASSLRTRASRTALPDARGTITAPSRPASACRRIAASARAVRASVARRRRPLTPPRCRALLVRASRVVVGDDDALHERMAHDVDLGERCSAMPSMSPSRSRASARPLCAPCGRSTWVTSPVTTAFERVAEARQEHAHLLARRVLRLVEDDEAVVERAAAHERERRDLDRAARRSGRPTRRGPSCRAARRRAGAGTG